MNSSLEYYKLAADEICDDVNKTSDQVISSEIEGINLLVFPHVYPSHKFRTTGFILKNIKEIVKNKVICDMGCGPGIIGLFSMQNGAKQVVQADINPNAVENAIENNALHGFGENQIKTFLSNCFDSLPTMTFDLIVFNIPFHCEKINIDDPLKYAFFDPEFKSIKKFLQQAKKYSHEKTQILIAFSNKGKVSLLESIFEQHNYKWELWKITNTDKEYDNRLYLLS